MPSRDVLALAHKASEMMFQNSDTSFSELSEGIEFVDENADGVVDPSDHVRRFGVIEAISVHDFLRSPSFPMGRFSHLSSRERLNILERGGSRFFDESYQASPEVLRIAADSQNASHRVFPVSPRRNWTRYC
ncbi:MAG: hypothetical protein IPJ69_13090 [Deltaproteobacteria bacterium]|nr:MAG: hypothetical protein IPJ69_13090 [Deltaproteobacteria bacterium]